MCMINGNLIAPLAEFIISITYISIILEMYTYRLLSCKGSRLGIITRTADWFVRDPDITVTALSYHRIKWLTKNHSIKPVLPLTWNIKNLAKFSKKFNLFTYWLLIRSEPLPDWCRYQSMCHPRCCNWLTVLY